MTSPSFPRSWYPLCRSTEAQTTPGDRAAGIRPAVSRLSHKLGSGWGPPRRMHSYGRGSRTRAGRWKTRVYILNVMSSRTAPSQLRLVRRLLLELAHTLTIAFLKPDIEVMRQLRFNLGTLLPDADRCFIEWVKYWKALPRASALPFHARSEVSSS